MVEKVINEYKIIMMKRLVHIIDVCNKMKLNSFQQEAMRGALQDINRTITCNISNIYFKNEQELMERLKKRYLSNLRINAKYRNK